MTIKQFKKKLAKITAKLELVLEEALELGEDSNDITINDYMTEIVDNARLLLIDNDDTSDLSDTRMKDILDYLENEEALSQENKIE